jgi:polysaccharide export outer membrane protein
VLAILSLVFSGCTAAIPAAELGEAVQGSTFTRQGEYLVSPSDQIAVKVYGQESLSGTFTVSPSGLLTFPLIGFIQAAGLTSLQLTDRLQHALQSYVKNPLVTLSVVSRDGLQVYFSGEFNKPGVAALTGRTTVLQGIAVGGGLTKFASGRVVLLRAGPNGAIQRYATTYYQLLSGRYNTDKVTLERGDVLHAE